MKVCHGGLELVHKLGLDELGKARFVDVVYQSLVQALQEDGRDSAAAHTAAKVGDDVGMGVLEICPMIRVSSRTPLGTKLDPFILSYEFKPGRLMKAETSSKWLGAMVRGVSGGTSG